MTISILAAAVLAFIAIASLLSAHFPAPGVLIAILAFVAAALQILRPAMSPAERAAWIVVFGCLVGLEVYAIYRDRGRLQAQYERDAQTRQEQYQRTSDKLEEMNRTVSASIVASTQRREFALSSRHDSRAKLAKRDALALSDDILRFLLDRQAEEPPLRGPQDVGAMIRWQQETGAQFVSKYDEQVLRVRNALDAAGIVDPEFDTWRTAVRTHGGSPAMIRAIAQRLGHMAAMIEG